VGHFPEGAGGGALDAVVPAARLALDLGKDKDDQELVTKFVTTLDKRLAEQSSSQTMAATREPQEAYTLEEAYETTLRVQAVKTRLRIARNLAPKVGESEESR
jgi:hypothetical protein